MIAILICAYFNKNLLDRTLNSIYLNESKYEFDIYFLENPSENSDEIYNLKKKYPNIHYYRCDKNVDIGIFDVFSHQYINILKKYKYITICEGDVELDKNSINENINILENNQEIQISSIKIHRFLEKYKTIQKDISNWTFKPTPYKNFNIVSATGLQFLTFRTHVYYDFLKNIEKYPANIALGCDNYTGINDQCIKKYCNYNKYKWACTKDYGLDHIAWEYIVSPEKDIYKYFKKRNLNCKQKKIRTNKEHYSKYILTELE